MREFFPIAWVAAAQALWGCGYSLQSNFHSDALKKDGIERIYIAPVVNDTYKTGVQSVVYNALVRALATFKGYEIVKRPEHADAILSSTVSTAVSQVGSPVTANQLNPATLQSQATRFADVLVASTYNALLTCTFTLARSVPKADKNIKPETLPPRLRKPVVWASTITRMKPFPGSNQLGILGDTSPLINDSEFDRALLDLAQQTAADVREGIISRF